MEKRKFNSRNGSAPLRVMPKKCVTLSGVVHFFFSQKIIIYKHSGLLQLYVNSVSLLAKNKVQTIKKKRKTPLDVVFLQMR
jgi:hypothetical protein